MFDMSVREQAAMMLGINACIEAAQHGLPLPDYDKLKKHGNTAMQILSGGVFNPITAMEFQAFMKENFNVA